MTHNWPRGNRGRPRLRADHDLRPPRYRLMQAAAKLSPVAPDDPTVSFERDCPTCGRAVLFTQLGWPHLAEYVVDEHDCA